MEENSPECLGRLKWCGMHNNYPYDHYCEDCEIICCIICLKIHSQHRTCTLLAFSKNVTQKIKNKLKTLKHILDLNHLPYDSAHLNLYLNFEKTISEQLQQPLINSNHQQVVLQFNHFLFQYFQQQVDMFKAQGLFERKRILQSGNELWAQLLASVRHKSTIPDLFALANSIKKDVRSKIKFVRSIEHQNISLYTKHFKNISMYINQLIHSHAIFDQSFSQIPPLEVYYISADLDSMDLSKWSQNNHKINTIISKMKYQKNYGYLFELIHEFHNQKKQAKKIKAFQSQFYILDLGNIPVGLDNLFQAKQHFRITSKGWNGIHFPLRIVYETRKVQILPINMSNKYSSEGIITQQSKNLFNIQCTSLNFPIFTPLMNSNKIYFVISQIFLLGDHNNGFSHGFIIETMNSEQIRLRWFKHSKKVGKLNLASTDSTLFKYITGRQYIIGKDKNCDKVINHKTIGSKHCEISRDSDWFLRPCDRFGIILKSLRTFEELQNQKDSLPIQIQFKQEYMIGNELLFISNNKNFHL